MDNGKHPQDYSAEELREYYLRQTARGDQAAHEFVVLEEFFQQFREEILATLEGSSPMNDGSIMEHVIVLRVLRSLKNRFASAINEGREASAKLNS